ncbi:hypothetical protein LOAG_09800 [Loa loa]|uniref:Cdc42 binding domain-containing protein n=1 Tax=Loa loa TaxID=7209 RepID=A0A1S0TRA7_LOALO|nr:hypothetical protein LOAG_09800 [Loa loa]EFO18694.1 hypothetical protein LOAG_09800 [Loa loa]
MRQSFTQSFNMISHMETHTDIEIVQLFDMPESLKAKRSLQRHATMHDKNRPIFNCTIMQPYTENLQRNRLQPRPCLPEYLRYQIFHMIPRSIDVTLWEFSHGEEPWVCLHGAEIFTKLKASERYPEPQRSFMHAGHDGINIEQYWGQPDYIDDIYLENSVLRKQESTYEIPLRKEESY